MPFVPGQMVKCVDNRPLTGPNPYNGLGWVQDMHGLRLWTVYTVRDVLPDQKTGPCVRLEEIRRPFDPFFGAEAAYRASRFVPIDDKALDIFRQVLTDAPTDMETVE